MNPNEPTHFNVLVAGTGLQESILAAALSKSGYSVLQLDPAPYYGAEYASLSLVELAEWARTTPGAEASSPEPPAHLLKQSQRFALSLFPMLLRAKGEGLDLLVRSKVAAYLQFGLLGGVGLFRTSEEGNKVERVPSSKADVFNNASLSLVEKRRLTKLLLLAAGAEPIEEDKVLAAEPTTTLVDYLQKAFSLSGKAAESLAYALALCSSPSDLALPAIHRIRTVIHAVGRYGPSPYLVGHYGGAGDLVGGFSRICAVWGGGQILGRALGALDLSPPEGIPVPPSAPPFLVHENPPPPPATPAASSSNTDSPSSPTETRPLGIAVSLEEGEPPTTLTGDWVVSSPALLPTLFPSATPTPCPISSVHLIAILPSTIPFPPPQGAEGEDAGDEPDSNLFVFPPRSLSKELGTVTALQTGKGTMSCPDGYSILYLSSPLLIASPDVSASALLRPYLDALLSPSLTPSNAADAPPPSAIHPLYAVSFPLRSPSSSSASLPPNLLVSPLPPAPHASSALVDSLDQLVPLVEETFWKIVGEEGRKEGVEFFRKEVVLGEDGEDE